MIIIFILYSHPQKARAQVTRRPPRIVSGRESRMSSDDHDHDDDDDLVLLRSEDPDPGILLHTPVSSRECPHWFYNLFSSIIGFLGRFLFHFFLCHFKTEV